ncbi:MAG: hypothetical protein IK004_07060 [Bacteroidales bacterium]|nr:hypothetical protein [Bacteroidales bacterium]
MDNTVKKENNVDYDLANAVSMDVMLNWVLEDIDEIYQKQRNNETSNNSNKGCKKVLI